jgi:hypothetical protein
MESDARRHLEVSSLPLVNMGGVLTVARRLLSPDNDNGAARCPSMMACVVVIRR